MQHSFSKTVAISTALLATFANAEGKFDLLEFKAEDGQTRPYVVYSPTKAAANSPLIVFLHGAVSNPQISQKPVEYAQRSPFVQLAEENGYYVLFPYGQKEATWFDQVGVNMVLGEIEQVKKQYKIDENKVFLSGFSDGGSGTFFFAATHSTPFAGFISLNGSVSVAANLGKSPVYLENFNHKPMYIVNTKSDMLYPVRMMQPTIDKIQQYHPQAIFRSPEGNHEMSYFPSLKGEINEFIQKNKRTAPTAISWESADNFSNSFAWLSISQRNEQETPKSWHSPYSLKMFNDKATFGFSPDITYTGEGMKVKSFAKRSVAKEMGVVEGDIILKMEDVELNHRYASFTYLSNKKAGDNTSLTLLRDGKEVVLTGKFYDGYEYEVFEKQPISAKVKAELVKDKLAIQTSRTAEIAIDFAQLPVKPNSKISLVINGSKPQSVIAKGVQKFAVRE